jgi:hypothetical protein
MRLKSELLLIHSLETTGKTIIELTEEQIHQFAGNVSGATIKQGGSAACDELISL